MSSFKTPPRHRRTPTPHRTPTPSRAGNRAYSTPRSEKKKTPGDRFIPNRAAGDMEFARYKIARQGTSRKCENTTSPSTHSPSQREASSAMREKLLSLKGKSSENRILSFKQTNAISSSNSKTPGKYDYWSPYLSSHQPSSSKKTRKLPKAPEKVLDAPNLINDYYLNVLDWGRGDQLAVALGGAVYLLDTKKGGITNLCELQPGSLYVSSLQWNRTGKYLAIGTSDAEVQLWDVNNAKLLRRMRTHQSRVDSLAWSPKTGLLSSGDQQGFIHHYDPRMAQFHVASVRAHQMDVCGLQWSPNGRFLASGGNDNVVKIWETYSKSSWNSPAHTIKHHTAAVKALSWCPWQPSLLATGGGSADKRICIWNACNGQLKCETKTGSQVSGLLWCQHHRELLSSHGNPNNKLNIWKLDPSCEEREGLIQVGELQGHEDRILHVSLSPDQQTVVSAAADETLRFWRCFSSIEGMRNSGSYSSSNSQLGEECTTPEFSMLRYIR